MKRGPPRSARTDTLLPDPALYRPRNARSAAAVATWSPRGRPGAPIAEPVTWEFFGGLKTLPVYSMKRPEEAARHFDAWLDFDKCRVKDRKSTRLNSSH